ncbi:MAG TPA: response regulator [Candidatus Binatia bacterium]|jgi:CheY-like chemotaxis protein|nr:response regulator [Candidatus Binatia bacterium]
MHLLLVEDNPADVTLVREAIATFIEQGTLQFSTVHDGAEALAFLRRREPYIHAASPDLVLLDLNLPVKSGYEVLAALKQDADLRYIPVVVLTTTQFPQDISQCYELGASAYLVKPLELEQFLSLVQLMVAFWSACKFRKLVDIEPGT